MQNPRPAHDLDQTRPIGRRSVQVSIETVGRDCRIVQSLGPETIRCRASSGRRVQNTHGLAPVTATRSSPAVRAMNTPTTA